MTVTERVTSLGPSGSTWSKLRWGAVADERCRSPCPVAIMPMGHM